MEKNNWFKNRYWLLNSDGFNKKCFISQLFGIFKDNDYNCIKEIKRLHCNKCNKEFVIKDYNIYPLIEIQKEYLDYDNINSIYLDKQFSDDIVISPECSKKIISQKKTCNIYYDIISKPSYMFFILDIDEDELCS